MTFIQKIKNEISETRAQPNATRAQKNPENEIRQSQDKVRQYVADVFLTSAHGSIKRGYQIDFVFDDSENARAFCDILAAYDIFPKLTHRVIARTQSEREEDEAIPNGHAQPPVIVYIKSREDICNLLALVGASNALLDLSNEIALREVRATANRRANCDSGNIAKTVATAAEQIDYIRQLDLENLDPKLRDVARARLENPSASYEELAENLGISKSGIVHRIRNLMSKD